MVDFYRRNDDQALSSIPFKANRLLYILLCLLAFIVLRIWYLSCVQHDKHKDEAFRARRKVLIQPAERGTIRDRFNTVLAANKIEYRLAISYAQIKDVPSIAFEGKKKRYLRREYIRSLAKMVAEVCGQDRDRIEDSIYSHAALLDTIPYIIKHNLTESEYYRLKALEKDYPGLVVERHPKRYYPKKEVGAHLIGYLGPMQKERYNKLIKDIRLLSEYIKNIELGLDVEPPNLDPPNNVENVFDAKNKLYELQERAYTINDDVGTQGVEASYEEELRGYYGKRIYFSDAKGNYVRPMSGSSDPLSGKRLILSLSAELQEYCEKLLAQSEKDRQKFNVNKEPPGVPWIRGGAIVAIDPKDGELVAMASYPRFNPNTFSRNKKKDAEFEAERFIESEAYVAKVWDQALPLTRELVGNKNPTYDFYNEEKWLDWKTFLEMILPANSPLQEKLAEDKPIADLLFLQMAFDEILKRAPALTPQDALKLLEADSIDDDLILFQGDIAPYKLICQNAFSGCKTIQEKLLLLDLSRLVIHYDDFTKDLVQKNELVSLSIKDFRKLTSAAISALQTIRKDLKALFYEIDFKAWRQSSEKEFLKKMRQKEKQKNELARPFLDYLNRREKALFDEFFRRHRFTFLEFYFTGRYPSDKRLEPYFEKLSYTISTAKEKELQELLLSQKMDDVQPLLRSFKGFEDQTLPLYGSYRGINAKMTKDLARSFVSTASSSYLRSYAYRQLTVQGSVFKLVTAYSGLKQLYLEKNGAILPKDCSLFEITDDTSKFAGKTYLGSFPDGKIIPQLYKGGRIPKSLNPHLGKMDLLRAIETSSNPYFSLLAGDFLHDPESLAIAAKDFGYGEKTGIDLPGEIPGNIPSDLKENRTGLYATAIGQHTLITTPLQTAVMLSAIANGGKVVQPKIVSLVVGKKHEYDEPEEVKVSCEVRKAADTIKRELFLPEAIRQTLLEGMRRSVLHAQEERYGALSRLYQVHPEMKEDFLSLQGDFVGKTSTAEVIERAGLDVQRDAHMYRHTWFGGISFKKARDGGYTFTFKDSYGEPELVVVVYLRYGGYGKEVAPIAAQVVKKWRQIKREHEG